MRPRQPCHTCNNNELKYYWHVPTNAYQQGVQGIYQGQGITKEDKKDFFSMSSQENQAKLVKGQLEISIPCTKGYSYRGTRPRPVKEHFNYLLYKQFFGTSRNTVLTPFIFSTHTNTDKLYQYLWHFMCLICEPCWHQVNADRQLKNQMFLVPRTPTRSIFAA